MEDVSLEILAELRAIKSVLDKMLKTQGITEIYSCKVSGYEINKKEP
jgi:hypothetical protein